MERENVEEESMSRPKFAVVNVRLPESVQQKLDEIYEDWTAKNGVEPSLRQLVIKLIMDYKIKNRP